MARKRKRTEPAPVTLEELPRDPEALTQEEAEAAKGGASRSALRKKEAEYDAITQDGIVTFDE